MYFRMKGDDFISILENIADEKGYWDEFTWFVFARSYAEWEDEYFGEEGVCFYIASLSVKQDIESILNYNEFYWKMLLVIWKNFLLTEIK